MKQNQNEIQISQRSNISNRIHGIEKYYEKIFYLILGSAGLLYAFLNPYFQTGFYNDDAIYVLVAQKLWKASSVFPHLGIKPDYPLPGLPLLLSPFAKLVNPHWTYLEWLSIIATFLSIVFLEKLARKWVSQGETLVILVLYAFNPVVAKFSGVMMPGPYYTLFALASFYLLVELLNKPSLFTAIALGFVMGWGSLMRPEGVLLSLSVLGALLITRQRHVLMKWIMTPMAGWLIFYLFWVHFQKAVGTEFGHDLRSLLSYWSGNFFSGISFVIQLPRVFLLDMLWVLRYASSSAASMITTVIIICCSCMLFIGFRSLWQHSTLSRCGLIAIATFATGYFLAHIFWHVAVPRYFLPLFPFVLIFVVRGGMLILEFFTNQKIWKRAILVILVLSYIYENGFSLYQIQYHPQSLNTQAWRTIEWIKCNIGADEKITSNFAPSIELYTGRHAKQGLNATNADLYLYLLMKFRIRYLVRRDTMAVAPAVGDTIDPNIRYQRKNRWIGMYPHRFPSVFSDAREKTRICRIDYNPKYVQAFEKFIDAVQEFEKGQYGKALIDVTQALDIYPNLGCAYNLLGALYMFQGHPDYAEAAFLNAEKLLPDSTFESLNLATLYYQKDMKERSLEYIKRGLEISTRNGEKTIYLENVRNLQQKWDIGGATLFIDSPNPDAYDENGLEESS
jgi:tetratricopeptide (TPR) repeat protein